eukprot:TRINITY_DN113341_c0_g1_i1.p1 TRINITY_DN113341_c0_g1~~TRINITY_DN113341_c0_g1_i1.p1  ORF type:complete len:879 (+),score=109.40 TRINITY_DN113341_c0_g1_i1:13-2649(+)
MTAQLRTPNNIVSAAKSHMPTPSIAPSAPKPSAGKHRSNSPVLPKKIEFLTETELNKLKQMEKQTELDWVGAQLDEQAKEIAVLAQRCDALHPQTALPSDLSDLYQNVEKKLKACQTTMKKLAPTAGETEKHQKTSVRFNGLLEKLTDCRKRINTHQMQQAGHGENDAKRPPPSTSTDNSAATEGTNSKRQKRTAAALKPEMKIEAELKKEEKSPLPSPSHTNTPQQEQPKQPLASTAPSATAKPSLSISLSATTNTQQPTSAHSPVVKQYTSNNKLVTIYRKSKQEESTGGGAAASNPTEQHPVEQHHTSIKREEAADQKANPATSEVHPQPTDKADDSEKPPTPEYPHDLDPMPTEQKKPHPTKDDKKHKSHRKGKENISDILMGGTARERNGDGETSAPPTGSKHKKGSHRNEKRHRHHRSDSERSGSHVSSSGSSDVSRSRTPPAKRPKGEKSRNKSQHHKESHHSTRNRPEKQRGGERGKRGSNPNASSWNARETGGGGPGGVWDRDGWGGADSSWPDNHGGGWDSGWPNANNRQGRNPQSKRGGGTGGWDGPQGWGAPGGKGNKGGKPPTGHPQFNTSIKFDELTNMKSNAPDNHSLPPHVAAQISAQRIEIGGMKYTMYFVPETVDVSFPAPGPPASITSTPTTTTTQPTSSSNFPRNDSPYTSAAQAQGKSPSQTTPTGQPSPGGSSQSSEVQVHKEQATKLKKEADAQARDDGNYADAVVKYLRAGLCWLTAVQKMNEEGAPKAHQVKLLKETSRLLDSVKGRVKNFPAKAHLCNCCSAFMKLHALLLSSSQLKEHHTEAKKALGAVAATDPTLFKKVNPVVQDVLELQDLVYTLNMHSANVNQMGHQEHFYATYDQFFSYVKPLLDAL